MHEGAERPDGGEGFRARIQGRIRASLPASIMWRVKFTAYRIRSRVVSGAIEMKTPPLSG